MPKKKNTTKKKVEKKEKKKTKSSNKKNIIVFSIIGIVLIIVGLCIAFQGNEPTSNQENPVSDIFVKELSPLELSEQKNDLEGDRITVLGAYVPSEAFIYIKEANDKIYLKPANKNYCRNYDLTGTLKYNYVVSRWELEVDNYDSCID